MRIAPCPRCGGDRLVAASRAFPEFGAGCWCPNGCGYASGNGTGEADTTPTEERIQFTGRVLPDASVMLEINVPKGRVGRGELRRLQGALASLQCGARDQERHLRGADRWIFGVEGGVYHALYDDHDIELVAYTAGKRKGLHLGPVSCEACRGPIVPGTRAYKPTNVMENYGRGQIRICAVCVETKPVRSPLGPVLSSDVRGAS